MMSWFRKIFTGLFVGLFSRVKVKASEKDVNKEFGTSTQRMGVRMTEGLRDVFRGRWIKKL